MHRTPPQMVGTPLRFDLFPFLGILLCYMGTLAFLQLLLSAGKNPNVALQVAASRGSLTTFQVYCKEDGVFVVPNVDGLAELAQRAGEDRDELEGIMARREQQLTESRHMPKQARFVTVEPDRVTQWLTDIALINRLCRTSGHRRQEFILFGIYPGGGKTYHEVRALLDGPDADPTFAGIAVGAEPLQSTWEVP